MLMSPIIILTNNVADAPVENLSMVCPGASPALQDLTDDAVSSEEEYSYIQFAEREQERARWKEESLVDVNGLAEGDGEQEQEQTQWEAEAEKQVAHGLVVEVSKRGGGGDEAGRRGAVQLEKRGGDAADGEEMQQTRLLGMCMSV